MLLLWPCLAESVVQRSGVRMFVLKSVCPIGIFTVTHQGAASEAASIHFGPKIRRTDILVTFLW